MEYHCCRATAAVGPTARSARQTKRPETAGPAVEVEIVGYQRRPVESRDSRSGKVRPSACAGALECRESLPKRARDAHVDVLAIIRKEPAKVVVVVGDYRKPGRRRFHHAEPERLEQRAQHHDVGQSVQLTDVRRRYVGDSATVTKPTACNVDQIGITVIETTVDPQEQIAVHTGHLIDQVVDPFMIPIDRRDAQDHEGSRGNSVAPAQLLPAFHRPEPLRVDATRDQRLRLGVVPGNCTELEVLLRHLVDVICRRHELGRHRRALGVQKPKPTADDPAQGKQDAGKGWINDVDHIVLAEADMREQGEREGQALAVHGGASHEPVQRNQARQRTVPMRESERSFVGPARPGAFEQGDLDLTCCMTEQVSEQPLEPPLHQANPRAHEGHPRHPGLRGHDAMRLR